MILYEKTLRIFSRLASL